MHIKGTRARTQSCNEADAVRQWKGQTEGVKLRLNCRIAVHCSRWPSDVGRLEKKRACKGRREISISKGAAGYTVATKGDKVYEVEA